MGVALGLGSGAATAQPGQTISAVEGAEFSGQVAAVDATSCGNLPILSANATINWGDGTPSPGSVRVSGEQLTVSGNHAYAEEGSDGGSATGQYACDRAGSPFSFSAGFTADVADAPLSAAGQAISAGAGRPFTGTVATFTDADPGGTISDYRASIDWGDGTTAAGGVISASGGGFAVAGTHTYRRAGPYSVTVTITDAGGSSRTATAGATVSAAPPAPRRSITLELTALPRLRAGAPFRVTLATVRDRDPRATPSGLRALVDWGDGASSRASISLAHGRGKVLAGHTYASSGRERVSVGVLEAAGVAAHVSETVRVLPALPAVDRTPIRWGRPAAHGDSTVVLRVRPPGAGTFTATGLGALASDLKSLRLHVRHAQPVTLVLAANRAGRRLLAGGHGLRGHARFEFAPVLGPARFRIVPVTLDLPPCEGKFGFTGAEQSCVVPAGVRSLVIEAAGANGGLGDGRNWGGDWVYGGAGGLGAFVVTPPITVTPGEVLYIEVGGVGGSFDAAQLGSSNPGLGGWDGGGPGGLGTLGGFSGGGGGATAVQTVSCAQVCDQALGFGTFVALASRVVVAGGGGGGGNGGAADGGSSTTRGGDGGNAGLPGADATVSGTSAITGLGGQPGTASAGGAGGSSAYQDTIYDGSPGKLGVGGAGRIDASAGAWYLPTYAGGGGGGGDYGGGGGGGGDQSLGNTVGGGGGGGGGSSYGPPGSAIIVDYGGSGAAPFAEFISPGG